MPAIGIPGQYMPPARRPPLTLPGNLGGIGPAPQGASDPNMLSTADTSDELSPTTIVLNYLKSKGMQPNAENIRRTIEANARDPGVLGPNLVGYNTPAGRDIELRNPAPENSAPAQNTSAPPQRPLPTPPMPPTTDGGGSPQALPTPNAGAPQGGLPPPPMVMPPPVMPSPVGAPSAPQLPPPPAGAAATPPSDPLVDMITRAIAPPMGPAPAQLPGPPQLPALPAPPPQLALPAPPTQPQIAAPPEVPRLPAPTPGLGGIPNTAPQGEPGGQVRIGNVQPKTIPGNPIRGVPIEPGPIMGPLGRSAVGGIAGSRAGPLGAAAGAAPGAIDLGRYIAKNLHLF
jgi:hypothetical protein